jgi:hypothetical protein
MVLLLLSRNASNPKGRKALKYNGNYPSTIASDAGALAETVVHDPARNPYRVADDAPIGHNEAAIGQRQCCARERGERRRTGSALGGATTPTARSRGLAARYQVATCVLMYSCS